MRKITICTFDNSIVPFKALGPFFWGFKLLSSYAYIITARCLYALTWLSFLLKYNTHLHGLLVYEHNLTWRRELKVNFPIIMTTKEEFEALKCSFTAYEAHLTRVCDSNARLAQLSTTVGAVAADGLQRGLISLDEHLDACEAQLLVMLKAAPAKDFDAVEALCDMLIRQHSTCREEVLEALAAILPDPITAAPAAAPAAGAVWLPLLHNA